MICVSNLPYTLVQPERDMVCRVWVFAVNSDRITAARSWGDTSDPPKVPSSVAVHLPDACLSVRATGWITT